MRPRWSITSQLLLVFCLVAALCGVAAATGYITASSQAGDVKQLTSHYQALQAADGRLEANFIGAAFAVHNYALTGDRSFLGPLENYQTAFAGNLATLHKLETPGLRPLIAAQTRAGNLWFDIVPQIIVVKPHTAPTKAVLSQSAALAESFVTASLRTQQSIHADIVRLTGNSRRAFAAGLTWSAAALVIAVLLVFATSLSTLYTIARPLRALAETVRRLTAGDHAARASVTGSAEVRAVAQSVNRQADEADRLRAAEAESNRLRVMARLVGVRIREHMTADAVLSEAQTALRENLNADAVYLRMFEDGRFISVAEQAPDWLRPPEYIERNLSADLLERSLTAPAVAVMERTFHSRRSIVVQDVQAHQGDEVIAVEILDALHAAGVVSELITPFGTGEKMLGIIVAQRNSPGHPWAPMEVDVVESIAAELGRALNRASLYEKEYRLVEDLKALDSVKSEFFATVSHELRAPLTTIEGYVEMLSDEEAGQITPQQRKMLETIERSSVRLRTLVEDLFTLSKLESGAISTELRQVDLAEIIDGAVAAVRPSVQAGGLMLDWPGLEDKLVVEGDASQLERVMINLLSNAVKFTPRGGHIEVSAGAEGGSAVVRVCDDGIGVPEQDQKELFSRFARASNATARRIPGTGLGLAIVRMIVEHHGGEVGLDSVEGAGTTVTVRLPLLETPGPGELAAPAGPGTAAG